MTISKILISQPAPQDEQKSPFSPLKERFGLEIDYRQFLSVEGATLKEFISQRVNILDHTAVVFTSRLLIDNFFRLVAESRVTIPEAMKYFCSSEAIALYLQKYIVYRKRKVFFATGSVTSLMDIILKHNTEKYLLPLSEPYKPELPMAMERAQLKHSTVVLSHTRSSDLSDLTPANYNIVALYSPSEVKNFKENFASNGFEGKLAAFGEATAKAALAEGLSVDMMAPTAKFPSMTSVITGYCKAVRNGDDLEDFAVKAISSSSSDELLKMAEKRKCRVRKTSSGATLSSVSSTRSSVSSCSGRISSRSATPRSASLSTKTLVSAAASSTTRRAAVKK